MPDNGLTIFCLDASNSQYSLPFEPWQNQGVQGQKRIPYYKKNDLFLSRSPESNTLSFLYKKCRVAIYWVDDYSRISAYEKAAPFRTILQWWFESNGSQMVHSAAVGMSSKGVLIPGGGGKGKSTLSVNCLGSGLDFLGDDYVLLSKNGEYTIGSIYNSAKLDDNSLNMLPFLSDGDKGKKPIKDIEKNIVFLNEYFPDLIKSSVKLKVILLPELSDGPASRVVEISASECFKAIAPSTIFQHIGRKETIIAFLFNLTKSIPSYKLLIGDDFHKTPQKIKDLIELI